MTDPRREVGSVGEDVAASFLVRHGLRIVARNVRLEGGELDILACHGNRRVAVEVRSVTGSEDPLRAFDDGKARRVRRLARRVGARRVDLVAVTLARDAAELRWVRGAG